MNPVFRLKNITVEYQETFALKDIDLEINSSDVLGVMGQSGTGKTTLLKLLSGIETPSRGTIWYKGTQINKKTIHLLRKNVTMLFQTPQFLRGTVYTNLAYGLRIRKIDEKQVKSRIKRVLEKVRLEGYQERDANSLSGGEQQRIALARALLLDPEVLLLDEPTSNLDPVNAQIISKVIEEEGHIRCVVISTHDYDQIKRLTNRTIYIDDGRITEEGHPSEIVSIIRLTENVFTGETLMENGVSQVNVGNIIIRVTDAMSGATTIHVSPKDIILSKARIDTSARNQFHGTIIGIEDLERIVRLSIDVGEVFKVQITRKSFEEMGLNLGSKVFINFKASSVIVI